MSKKTLITSRDPKGLQTVRLFEDAYNKAGLDEGKAQRINERGGEFQEGVVKLIEQLSMSNRFADEEVSSNYGYLSGCKPKGITEQTNILRQLFPGIGFANEKITEQPLPPKDPHDSEFEPAWFVILKWEKIAGTYCEAVQKVLNLIKQARNGKFCNYREGQLGPRYLRQHERTEAFLKRISEAQGNHDILVIPAQFGFRHRGRSVRRAREVMNASEFGLGVFAVGIMLLTHPERLQHYDDLWIDCPGDEYSFEASGRFDSAPCFSFVDGSIEFRSDRVDLADARFGSASAFWQ